MELAPKPEKYTPKYNPTLDIFEDESPFQPYAKKNQVYKCPCNGYLFSKTNLFNSHIKSNTHKNWLENYKENNKELNDAKSNANSLLAENTILKRKIDKKDKYIDELEKEVNKYRSLKRCMKMFMDDIEEDDDANFSDVNS
tara:strand:- start:461 stop:883 length:423 start_codon:yes stop_codon:yes gene_type:complete